MTAEVRPGQRAAPVPHTDGRQGFPPTVEVRRGAPDAATVAAWETLAERVGASPFVRPGWVRAWVRAFGRGTAELWGTWRDGELVAVCPLLQHWGTYRSPTNFHTPLFSLVTGDSSAAVALVAAVVARSVRRLDLDSIDEDDAAIVGVAARRVDALVLDRGREPAAYVALHGDWQAFEEGLSRNQRKSVRRGWKGLRQQGTVTVETIRDPDGLDAFLAEFMGVEASGWKGERGTAIASRPNTRQFYRDVAHWAAERGWLRLTFLRLDGRPVAVDFGLDHDGVNYSLKCGYDERFSRWSPGNLLLHRLLASLTDEGFHRMDLLEGSWDSKRRWASHAVVRRRVQVFPRSAAGRAEWAAWSYGRPLAKEALAAAHRTREAATPAVNARRGAPLRL